MRELNRSWTPGNEQTRPLDGTPIYRSSGIIKVCDDDMRFAIALITFERFDDQNFQYIFTPFWRVIDTIPIRCFPGIPGINLDYRLEHYYRVNMTPVFISERTPGTSRENLWEMLESVGMDYYDRFEWLLRTKARCGTDNLIVDRLPENERRLYLNGETPEATLESLSIKDDITIKSLHDVGDNPLQFQQNFLWILQSGASVYIEDEERSISDLERESMMRVLFIQREIAKKMNKSRQAAGIEKAKKEKSTVGANALNWMKCWQKQSLLKLKRERQL